MKWNLPIAGMIATLIFWSASPSACAQNTPGPGGGASDSAPVLPASSELFVITHADRIWDQAEVSRTGIVKAIARLKPRMPVLLLSNTSDRKFHFLSREVHFLLPSESGELHFSTPASRFFLAGGFLGSCLDRTKHFLLLGWDRNTPEINLTYITDGVFGGAQLLRFFDRETADLLRKEWKRSSETKLETLAEFFRFIDQRPDAMIMKQEFIRSWVQEFESNHPDLNEIQHEARMEIRVKGEIVFSRPGTASPERIIRIEFLESHFL